jgi:hypothetical protein
MATGSCDMCDKAFEEGQKKIELLCDHTFHTECFVQRGIQYNYIPDIQCYTCSARIVPDEVIERIGMFQDELGINNVIQFTFETNDDFKNDLKGIQAAAKEDTAADKEFDLKNKKCFKEFKSETATAVSFLKLKVEEAKKKVKVTEEYKTLKNTKRNFLSRTKAFRRKWGMAFYHVRRVLHGNDAAKPYFKGIPEYYSRIIGGLWKFRIRIR